MLPTTAWQIQDHPILGDWVLAPFRGNPRKPELRKILSEFPTTVFLRRGDNFNSLTRHLDTFLGGHFSKLPDLTLRKRNWHFCTRFIRLVGEFVAVTKELEELKGIDQQLSSFLYQHVSRYLFGTTYNYFMVSKTEKGW